MRIRNESGYYDEPFPMFGVFIVVLVISLYALIIAAAYDHDQRNAGVDRDHFSAFCTDTLHGVVSDKDYCVKDNDIVLTFDDYQDGAK